MRRGVLLRRAGGEESPMIDEALLRHLYHYDRTLPLLPTSEPAPGRDLATYQPVEGVARER